MPCLCTDGQQCPLLLCYGQQWGGGGMSVCVSVGRRDETSVPSCPQRLAVLIVLNLPDVSKTRTFAHTVTPDSGCSRQPRLSTFHHSPSAQRSPDRKSFPDRAKGNGNSTRHFFFSSFKTTETQNPTMRQPCHNVSKASSPPSLPFMNMNMNMAALSHKRTCH